MWGWVIKVRGLNKNKTKKKTENKKSPALFISFTLHIFLYPWINLSLYLKKSCIQHIVGSYVLVTLIFCLLIGILRPWTFTLLFIYFNLTPTMVRFVFYAVYLFLFLFSTFPSLLLYMISFSFLFHHNNYTPPFKKNMVPLNTQNVILASLNPLWITWYQFLCTEVAPAPLCHHRAVLPFTSRTPVL